MGKPENGMKKKRRLIIGLTGPMSAGKNAAADILHKKGFTVLDADIIAHGVLERLTADIVRLFYEDARRLNIALTDETGMLDRKKLAFIVFKDAQKLSLLENLIHPHVNAEIEKQIADFPEQSFVINAALLHKTPVIKRCDFILYIDAPIVIRLLRARKRDGLPLKRIAERFLAQRQIFAKCKKQNADIYRVGNSSSKERLENNLEAVLQSLT